MSRLRAAWCRWFGHSDLQEAQVIALYGPDAVHSVQQRRWGMVCVRCNHVAMPLDDNGCAFMERMCERGELPVVMIHIPSIFPELHDGRR